MPSSRAPVVVFDLGGVLVSQTSQVPDAARALGADESAVDEAYWRHRLAWDLGCPDLEYWGAVGRDVAVEVDEQLADALAEHDARLWTTLRPAAWQLLADVHAHGTTAWALSNAASHFAPVIDDRDWRGFLAGCVVSGVERCVKPEPEIYAITEQRIGTTGLAFVDDRADNVAAALARGWQAHLWVDDADTRAWLEGLGAL